LPEAKLITVVIIELIPDPVIGSGPIVPSLADVFSRDEFEKINQETTGLSSSSKQLKQITDMFIHEIKPSQRTK
jgi:cohesin loading factor subunit SCC2